MRGGDKLLEPVEGRPLLRLLAERAVTLGLPVIVTLPPDAPARHAALGGIQARPLVVPDAATGMAASFRALAREVPEETALMIVLGDMPEITSDDMGRIVDAWRADGGLRVARATTRDGSEGQPLILPARLVPALRGLEGDRGARAVVAGEDNVKVPLPGSRATVDLDTPEAWAAWRADGPSR